MSHGIGVDEVMNNYIFIAIYIRPLDEPVWPKLLVDPDELKPGHLQYQHAYSQ